jgi:phosphoribosyl 1,2-cyclic phosphate phosphodiesterase
MSEERSQPCVATVLGCGSSAGVPRVAGGWGACDPNEPKNRRLRCSLLVERAGPDGRTIVLVDTSPDLRAQLLAADVQWLDGVLLTHDHADHVHGIDDLRPIVIHNRRRVGVYMAPDTADRVTSRFGYCFNAPEGSSYPPILDAHAIRPPAPVVIPGAGGDIIAQPVEQLHGETLSLGFRFGGLAYSCDVSGIPEESERYLQDLDVWILDALRYTPHPSHFTLDEALEWIARVKPRRAILTNMHIDLDYATLRRKLPPGVEPAYDGMQIAFDPSR